MAPALWDTRQPASLNYLDALLSRENVYSVFHAWTKFASVSNVAVWGRVKKFLLTVRRMHPVGIKTICRRFTPPCPANGSNNSSYSARHICQGIWEPASTPPFLLDFPLYLLVLWTRIYKWVAAGLFRQIGFLCMTCAGVGGFECAWIFLATYFAGKLARIPLPRPKKTRAI